MVDSAVFRLSITASAGAPVSDAELQFDRDVVYLGRRAGCDVQLPSAAVSAVHARIDRAGDSFSITDLSSNGTHVRGVRIPPRRATALAAGDSIALGPFTLTFHGALAPGSTAAPETPPATTRSIARRMVAGVLAAMHDPAAPRLRIVSGPRAGTEVTLAEGAPIELGRDDGCDLPLPDPDASRRNTRILRGPTETVAVDLSSKNGTLLNDRPITVSHTLHHGDRITVGGTTVLYQDPTDDYLAKLDHDAEPDPVPDPAPAPAREKPPYLILAIALAAAAAAIATLWIIFS